MITRKPHIVIFVILLFLATQSLMADTGMPLDKDAMKQMADIMMHLNHYPSPSEKESLKKISDNASLSAPVRNLAVAMHNLKHKVDPGDKEKLQKIAADESADKHQRALAEIMLGLSHQPSQDDKEKLRKMME